MTGTTLNAYNLTPSELQLELWMWRSYISCGSDIFGSFVLNDDMTKELDLSDNHYLIWKYGEKKLVADLGDSLGVMPELYEYGFDLEDIFIGLWDRLNNPSWENMIRRRFQPIIKDMHLHWDEYISSPPHYEKLWRELKQTLETDLKKVFRKSFLLGGLADKFEKEKDKVNIPNSEVTIEERIRKNKRAYRVRKKAEEYWWKEQWYEHILKHLRKLERGLK